MKSVLEVSDLWIKYYTLSGIVHAVSSVSFQLGKGEMIAVVGESGSGKSTLGKVSLRLYKPAKGRVMYKDDDITDMHERALRPLRREMQLTPQDPYGAVAEPLITHYRVDKVEVAERVYKSLEEVGLIPVEDFVKRKPHELSGGQLQRAVIARTMILRPKYVVADEPTSNLDASIRTSIIELLLEFKKKYNQSILFITHDIVLLSLIASKIGVMYLAQLIEEGPTESILKDPLHPYTKALLSAIPFVSEEIGLERVYLKGEIGDPANPPTGCRLHPRCPFTSEKCYKEEPPFIEIGNSRFVRCWLYFK